MLRIGSGAGYAGDRIAPALVLAEKGNLDYLVFECLAERTIAAAQMQKQNNPELGYNDMLAERFQKLLPIMQRKHFRVITNMGAANPIGGARKIIEIANNMGYPLKVAVVTGDDVLTLIDSDMPSMEYNRPVREEGPIISANAYIGVDAILPALKTDADIIITGRAADPSLFLAPIVFHYGWRMDDWDRLARGTVVGHLLECSGQVTGGYFADPGKKEVPDLANLGFPLAEVEEDGTAVITKVEGTGGLVSLSTVKEQFLYEISNPHGYITPDVVADFTTTHITEIGKDRVRVSDTKGYPRTDTLKVSVGYKGGYMGVGRVVLAGPNAYARARLGAQVVLEQTKDLCKETRVDYMGLNSVHGEHLSEGSEPYEIILRMACRTDSMEKADAFGRAVENLCLTGPAATGGLMRISKPIIGIVSILIPRDKVKTGVSVLSAEDTKTDSNVLSVKEATA